MFDEPTPSVSVVIPTYRRHRYLIGATRSVLAQTFPDFEVILTDNDSEGQLPRELAELADPRLRYRRNSKNLGMLGNVLAGIHEARGRYVATLHDDDLWEPQLLERLVPHLDADPGLAVAFADHHVIDEKGRIDVAWTDAVSRTHRRDRLAPGRHADIARMALLDGSIPVVLAAVLRKSAVDWHSFSPEVGSAYDIWLAYLLYRGGGAAYYCPERLARYRIHSGAETLGNRIGHEQAAACCYERILLDQTLRPLHRDLGIRYAYHRVGAATVLLREGRVQEARRNIKSALRRDPGARTLVALLVSILPAAAARGLTLALAAFRRRVSPVSH